MVALARIVLLPRAHEMPILPTSSSYGSSPRGLTRRTVGSETGCLDTILAPCDPCLLPMHRFRCFFHAVATPVSSCFCLIHTMGTATQRCQCCQVGETTSAVSTSKRSMYSVQASLTDGVVYNLTGGSSPRFSTHFVATLKSRMPSVPFEELVRQTQAVPLPGGLARRACISSRHAFPVRWRLKQPFASISHRSLWRTS